MELFRLLGTIAITNTEANEALDETADKASNTHSSVSSAFSKIGNVALAVGKVVATGLAAISAGFIALGTQAVQYNAQLENYQTSFEVMLGSQEEALGMMEKLKSTAASTPFELPDLADTTQLLLNYGFTADEATGKMLMLGDIAQGSAEKMNRIATAYGQMSSAGKVHLEDIKQMIENGYNPMNDIIAITGETQDEFYERLSRGEIAVDEVTAAMERATSEGGKYYQSMEKQSQTFEGKLSTLKDTINNALGEAFKGVSEIMVSQVFPTLTELAETYIPRLGDVVERILPPLMTVIENLLPSLLDSVDSMLPLFIQFIEDLMPALSEAMDVLLPIFMQLSSDLVPNFIDLIRQILLESLPLIQELLPLLLSLISELTPQLNELFMLLLPILNDLLIILLPPLMELLIVIARDVMPQVVDAIRKVTSFISEYVIPLIQALMEVVILPTLQNLVSLLKEHLGGVIKIFTGTFEYLSGLFDFWLSLIQGDWQGAWDACGKCLEGFKKIVVGIFESAFFFITDTIKRIKENLNFNFNIAGLGQAGLKLGVETYASGGVMKKPTVFGMHGSNLMIGGEAGDEAIAPIDVLQGYVSQAVASQNAGLVAVLEQILSAILALDMGESMRDALEGTALSLNNREFARLVKAVN